MKSDPFYRTELGEAYLGDSPRNPTVTTTARFLPIY